MNKLLLFALSAFFVMAEHADNPSPNTKVFAFKGDAQTGVTSTKTYTHALDFATGNFSTLTQNAILNGVQFTSTTGTSGSNFSGLPGTMNNGSTTYASIATPAAEDVYQLLKACNAGTSSGTMKFTGLTPGVCYEARFYNRVWTVNGNRFVDFVASPNGGDEITSESFTFNCDGAKSDRVLAYRYIAGADGTLSLKHTAQNSTNPLHVYAFTNEEVEEFSVLLYPLGTRVDPSVAVVNAQVALLPADGMATIFWGTTNQGEDSANWEYFTTQPIISTAGEPANVSCLFDNIEYGREYFVWVMATAGEEEAWSSTMSFTTVPAIELDPIANTLFSPANVTVTGRAPMLRHDAGTVTVCWGTLDG